MLRSLLALTSVMLAATPISASAETLYAMVGIRTYTCNAGYHAIYTKAPIQFETKFAKLDTFDSAAIQDHVLSYFYDKHNKELTTVGAVAPWHSRFVVIDTTPEKVLEKVNKMGYLQLRSGSCPVTADYPIDMTGFKYVVPKETIHSGLGEQRRKLLVSVFKG